jgi:hypothetical protein
MYEIIKVQNTKFYFKKELNPLKNEYEYHIWIRHLIEPIDAIIAYLNQSEKIYNQKHKRYEVYSNEDKIHVWYFYRNNNSNEVNIITAFRGEL